MSIEAVVLYLLIVVCGCVVAIYRSNQERDMYKEWYEDKSKKYMALTRENYGLKIQNVHLNSLLQERAYNKATRTVSYENKDIVDAVKYAMKAAHPDNGGKQEDFIKFNSLYNKIR